MPDKTKRLIALVAIVLTALVAIYNASQEVSLESNPTIGYDEKMWTSASVTTYHMLFTDYVREVEKLDPWFENFAKKYGLKIEEMDTTELQWYAADIWTFGWKSPNVAKALMGASVVLGADTAIDKAGYFNKWYKKELRVGQGANPPKEFVRLARIPNAIFYVLTVLLISLLGWQFFNPFVGWFAGAYLALNETFTRVTCAAGMDSLAIFFSTLSLFFVFHFLKECFDKRNFTKLALLGLGIGIAFPLAVGSKLNSALAGYVMLTVFGIYAVLLLKKLFTAKDKSSKNVEATESKQAYAKHTGQLIGIGAGIGILTYFIFTSFNPIFKSDPSTKATVLQESVDGFFERRAMSKGTSKVKDNFKKSFELVFKRNFFEVEKRYYGTLGSIIPGKFNPLDGLLYYLALIIIVFQALVTLIKNGKINAYAILAVWSLIFIWGNTDFMWTDFGRYHMPFYPSSGLMIGLGISFIAIYIQQTFFKKNKNEKAAAA